MPIPILANRPKAGWAVLLYGPPPEIQLLAGELGDSGLEIVRIGDHFFLQAPEVFDPLSWPEEVATDSANLPLGRKTSVITSKYLLPKFSLKIWACTGKSEQFSKTSLTVIDNPLDWSASP